MVQRPDPANRPPEPPGPPRLPAGLGPQVPILVLLLCILVLYLGTLLALRLTRPAPIDREVLGMVVRDPWYDFGTAPGLADQPNYAAQDRMGAMLAQLGVRWVRLEFHIEGSDALSVTQVARNDYFIREVAPRHNIQVLGLLSFGLIRGQDPRLLGDSPGDAGSLSPTGQIWLNRARMIVSRYGGAVAAYEIFNEPNRFSATGEDAIPAATIARLQTSFYTFFRHIDRFADGSQAWRDRVPIILGGPQPAGTGRIDQPGYISDSGYLRQIYTADAFVGYRQAHGQFPLDGIAYHPYPEEIARSTSQIVLTANGGASGAGPTPTPTPEGPRTPAQDVALIVGRLDRLRATLAAVGDPQQPFWITEIGYNVAYGQNTEAGQADFLRQVYSALAARPDVARVFWFKYEDFPPAIGPHAQQWGNVVIPFVQDTTCPGASCYQADGHLARLRPSFWAYRQLAGIGPTLPEPPAAVDLRGPNSGTINTPMVFTAAVSRTTASLPIAYAWQADRQAPSRSSGKLRDAMTFSWAEPGSYTVTVVASNAAGSVIDTHQVTVGYRPPPVLVWNDPATPTVPPDYFIQPRPVRP